jgi:uncharacterized protein
VVQSCVNNVGVNLNTASKSLLTYVSGLGPQIAQNIVAYRNEHGSFSSRAQLKKVPRLGEKAFEQCAGFLRISKSKNAYRILANLYKNKMGQPEKAKSILEEIKN